MNTVITAKEAKHITGGRTPLVPFEYESAIKALTACVTIDDAKYWSDKADALAAWAKIYHSDEAGLKSKQLKLHAYRKMGQLAGELRPNARANSHDPQKRGWKKGPHSLLREQGLTHHDALAARKLSKLPEKEFKQLLTRPRAPVTAACMQANTEWRQFNQIGGGLRAYMNRTPARQVASTIGPEQIGTAKKLATDLIEWLDEFEQHLPKGK
jgi:hypothetical protein